MTAAAVGGCRVLGLDLSEPCADDGDCASDARCDDGACVDDPPPPGEGEGAETFSNDFRTQPAEKGDFAKFGR